MLHDFSLHSSRCLSANKKYKKYIPSYFVPVLFFLCSALWVFLYLRKLRNTDSVLFLNIVTNSTRFQKMNQRFSLL